MIRLLLALLIALPAWAEVPVPPLKGRVTDLTGTLNKNENTVEGVLKRLPNKLGKLTGTASYGSWFNFYLCDFDGRIVLPKTKQVIAP